MRRSREGALQTWALVWPASVALALAAWGGIRVWQASALGTDTQPWLAMVLGANLFLLLWVWYSARPSGFCGGMLPGMALLTAAMLLEKLPRVFWPAVEGLHLTGSIASKLVLGGVVVMQMRRIGIEIHRRRRSSRGARSA